MLAEAAAGAEEAAEEAEVEAGAAEEAEEAERA